MISDFEEVSQNGGVLQQVYEAKIGDVVSFADAEIPVLFRSSIRVSSLTETTQPVMPGLRDS
jgi:hypothetical protein